MKSMKAKAKAKKANNKFNRDKFSSKEDSPVNPDLSQLHQPIDTSLSTLYRVTKVLENGSDEVKSILAYECDLVYECRVCRSLFRSLVNFISHKRIYCKEKFNITFVKNFSNDYDTNFEDKSDTKESEKLLREICKNDRILRSQASKEEQKKDLTAIVNMLQHKYKESLCNNTEQMYLESVQSNSSAVYQTVDPLVPNENHMELMKAQVIELNNMTNEQTAMLDPSGKLSQSSQELKNNNASQTCKVEAINNNYENEIICSICNARFSTKKTLSVHTRTLHTSHRLCYPCPCCTSTFANTWSVYRHLFKVHRKSNEQVRKLRSQIQEKAFIKDTTVAEDLQKEQANKTLENSIAPVNETQEWMDYLESDAELQRCGGCGKRFDRKAALSAHSQYCHRRNAAFEGTTKVKKANKISPDRDSNQNTATTVEARKGDTEVQDFSDVSESSTTNEMCIRVEAVASLSKEDWDMIDNQEPVANGVNEDVTIVPNNAEKTKQDNVVQENNSHTDSNDPIEIVYTDINKHKTYVGSSKRKNKENIKKLSNTSENNKKPPPPPPPPKEPVQREKETEKLDYALLMENKITSIVSFQKLECLPCQRKFTSVTNLRKHAAIHIGWNRYRCKLCDFKCFVKCDCVAHCNKMHNAQNNRVIIENMISPISDDEYNYDQQIMYSINKTGTPSPILEDVQVIFPPETVEPETPVQEVEPETRIQEEKEAEIEIKKESTLEVEKKATSERKADASPKPEVLEDVIPLNTKAQETLNSDVKCQNTLELDPDLRRMVMEVIFGSSEVNSTKESESSESVSSSDDNSKLQTKNFNAKETDIICVQDSSKPQRPVRNRIKPLNKDFVYDLKEVTCRKDSLIIKPFTKPLAKKTLPQEEDSIARDIEQPSKRFKSVQSSEVSIICENNIIKKCDIDIDRDGLKNNLTFSQCHS